MGQALREIQKVCLADTDPSTLTDPRKATQLLEVYALTIQVPGLCVVGLLV